jgi:hypothetical protein
MTALALAFAVAGVLLVVGGVSKAALPHDTARAFGMVGLPSSPVVVRAGAVMEIAVGASALVLGARPLAALVAASYSGFTAFVVVALARGSPLSTCGCVGRSDTPPTMIHVALDAALALVALVAAVEGDLGLVDVLPDQPGGGVPFLAVLVIGTALAYVLLTKVGRLARQ